MRLEMKISRKTTLMQIFAQTREAVVSATMGKNSL